MAKGRRNQSERREWVQYHLRVAGWFAFILLVAVGGFALAGVKAIPRFWRDLMGLSSAIGVFYALLGLLFRLSSALEDPSAIAPSHVPRSHHPKYAGEVVDLTFPRSAHVFTAVLCALAGLLAYRFVTQPGVAILGACGLALGLAALCALALERKRVVLDAETISVRSLSGRTKVRSYCEIDAIQGEGAGSVVLLLNDGARMRVPVLRGDMLDLVEAIGRKAKREIPFVI